MNAFGTKRATREKCLGCGALRTPCKVRWQYKRAIRHRLTPDEALMPRCQKCLTKALGYEHHHDGGLHTHALHTWGARPCFYSVLAGDAGARFVLRVHGLPFDGQGESG
jgi:hypothetical protein